MKLIVESRWKGDYKWNFRAELQGNTPTQALLKYYRLIKEDTRLRADNDYRLIIK